MALVFPYPLAFFSDTMLANKVQMVLRRFDETSGGGDGRFWTNELAKPLWAADVSLADRDATLAHDFQAKIDGLDGGRNTFLFADPTYPGPSGGTSGLGGVSISSISGDRSRIALSGLPSGFQFRPGDRFTVTYGSGRVYLGRFSEVGTANASGVSPSREIRPYLPLGIGVSSPVELLRPYFKAFISSYTPFEFDLPEGLIARGGSLQILQKP